jgi:hypothetical protein
MLDPNEIKPNTDRLDASLEKLLMLRALPAFTNSITDNVLQLPRALIPVTDNDEPTLAKDRILKLDPSAT